MGRHLVALDLQREWGSNTAVVVGEFVEDADASEPMQCPLLRAYTLQTAPIISATNAANRRERLSSRCLDTIYWAEIRSWTTH